MRGPKLGSGNAGLGKRFGRLVVIGLRPKYRLCLCDCGNKKIVRCSSLLSGSTRSCGHLRGKDQKGLSRHPLYIVWASMLRRCYDSKNPGYVNYGGRGIYVCYSWKNNFHAFFSWAKCNGWKPGLDLDRVDNDGHYEPKNCRFVTRLVNCNNRTRKASA